MVQQLFTTRAHSLSVYLSLSLSLPLFRSPALRQQQVSASTTTTAAQLAQTSRNKCRTKLSSGSTMPRVAVVEQFENDFRARQTCKDVLEFECEQKERKINSFIRRQQSKWKKNPNPNWKVHGKLKEKVACEATVQLQLCNCATSAAGEKLIVFLFFTSKFRDFSLGK